MAQEKQFLLDLKRHFKLNIYEVKIWTAILSKGIASAGELADISGVPRSRCYDVLESLEKKGFVIMKIGKPIKYLAINPSAIIERVKRDITESAEQLSMQFEGIKGTDEFRELELLHKTGVQHVDISSISKSIVGRTAINRHIKNMMSKASSSLIAVSTQEHVERNVKLLKGLMHNFARKGVKPRLYAPFSKSIAKKAQNVEYFEYNASASFVSVDSREIVFIISSDNVVPDYEVAIWLSSPFFVNAVNVIFDESLKGLSRN